MFCKYLLKIVDQFSKVNNNTSRLSGVKRLWSTTTCESERTFENRHCIKKGSLFELLDTMPKEPKEINELRKMRIKSKVPNKLKPIPGTIFLSVIGNGSSGNPRCLYLFADLNCYIFNCGEGSQRLAQEHKMKLSKLEHVFFTHKSWENVGGLPGLALTVQDIGVPELDLHGPSGTDHLLKMASSFMVTKNLVINMKTPEMPSYEDNCMKVFYVPLYSSIDKTYNINDELEISKALVENEISSDSSSDCQPAQKRQRLSSNNSSPDLSVAYICKFHNKLGQLQLDKCVDQGVPPGPLLGQLKAGIDVVLPNGTMVKASDVVSKEETGPVMIVLECPDENFLEALLREEAFAPHQKEAEDPSLLATVVVHFSPAKVVANPKYQDWMRRFSSSTSHMMMNDYNCTTSSIAVHRIQYMLGALNDEIFPKLHEKEKTAFDTSGTNIIQPNCGFRFTLRPTRGIDLTKLAELDTKAFQSEMDDLDGFPKAISDLHKEWQINRCIQSDNNFSGLEYPEIVFLGTGSAQPSKVRNVSSILINIRPDLSMMLDCGEGTFNQFLRFHGEEKSKLVLSQMKCIYISHLHADHHLGLLQMLRKRWEAFKTLGLPFVPLILLAPFHIKWWILNYHKYFEPVTHLLRLIPNDLFLINNKKLKDTEYRDLISELQLKDISTVYVKHCKQSYGVTLTTQDNFKLVYSGDTMPCLELAQAGKDCSLLIHEATMEDNLADDAFVKTHSTTTQAIEMGQKMNSKFTILTHFSQRYAKIPLFNESFSSNVGFAFDNMKVHPHEFKLLPLLNQPLNCLFKEHVHEMMEKTARKLHQRTIMHHLSQLE